MEIKNIHKIAFLKFSRMSLEEFKKGDLVHRSPKSKRGFKGSEYRIFEIKGRAAFARESNHWGEFSTSSPISSGTRNWVLEGVKTGHGNNARYAGFVFIDEISL
jgi:hypothetical protein